MSVENYAKFIAEQVRKSSVAGFRSQVIESAEQQEEELTLEEEIDLLNTYIEDLEAHFDAEDLQELSTYALNRYAQKVRNYDHLNPNKTKDPKKLDNRWTGHALAHRKMSGERGTDDRPAPQGGKGPAAKVLAGDSHKYADSSIKKTKMGDSDHWKNVDKSNEMNKKRNQAIRDGRAAYKERQAQK